MHGSGTVNLVGIHAKLGRVERQINEITSEADRLCADVHRSIVREVREDLDKQLWVYRGETPDVPVEWSVTLGEILHNLRSALDHLVWQLVLANGQTPGRHSAFPIATDSRSWKKTKDTLLKGIRPRHVAMIEYLQPYTVGMDLPFDVRMLEAIRDLSNIEKHRHLVVAVIASDGIEENNFEDNLAEFDELSKRVPLDGEIYFARIETGRILARFNNADMQLTPSFRVDTRFAGDAQHLTMGMSIPDLLTKCLHTVKGSVDFLTTPMGDGFVETQGKL